MFADYLIKFSLCLKYLRIFWLNFPGFQISQLIEKISERPIFYLSFSIENITSLLNWSERIFSIDFIFFYFLQNSRLYFLNFHIKTKKIIVYSQGKIITVCELNCNSFEFPKIGTQRNSKMVIIWVPGAHLSSEFLTWVSFLNQFDAE